MLDNSLIVCYNISTKGRTNKMLNQLTNAKLLTVNNTIVYYVNVDTNEGEIPDDCWDDWA